MNSKNAYSVVIIGAGAAGVGLGVIFEKMGFSDYVILEKDTVGSSFKQWPHYTRFISPSFTGNSFNAMDLNAVTPDTSPAYSLKTEHPSGKLYAEYLELVADHFKLNVQEQTNVTEIGKRDDVFFVHTPGGILQSRFIVWAGGEFQYPSISAIPGAEHCIHSSHVNEVQDSSATIIGGFESGMELAIHLLERGKEVTIIDRGEPWEVNAGDSSISLAPYTRDRLHPYIGSEHLTLIGNTEVSKITREQTGYAIHTKGSEPIQVPHKPILATGFASLPPVIETHFAETTDGHIAITEDDESAITPNLFLAGPKVRHGEAIFCFIYKFRQRLPIIAESIIKRLGTKTADIDGLEEYKRAGMYLKDLSCCADECAC